MHSRRGRSQLDPGGKHQSDETGGGGETGARTEAAFHIPNKYKRIPKEKTVAGDDPPQSSSHSLSRVRLKSFPATFQLFSATLLFIFTSDHLFIPRLLLRGGLMSGNPERRRNEIRRAGRDVQGVRELGLARPNVAPWRFSDTIGFRKSRDGVKSVLGPSNRDARTTCRVSLSL